MTGALDDGSISARELDRILGILTGQDWSVNVGVHMDDQELNDFMAQWNDLGPAGQVVGALPGGGNQRQPEARAAGGPITAGRPYLVGEKGPELIVPNRDAYVVPNGAGNVYNFYGYNNPTAIAQRLAVLEAFGV